MLTRAEFGHRANGPRLLLADHHREIEAACEALRACIYADDPTALTARYRSFERAVLEHLTAEDEAILPLYAEHAPSDAAMLRTTHEELRRQLYRIGIDVELHCVRAPALEQLVRTLREHAAHEDRALYPWAEAHLPLRTRRELFARIGRSLRTLVGDSKPAA